MYIGDTVDIAGKRPTEVLGRPCTRYIGAATVCGAAAKLGFHTFATGAAATLIIGAGTGGSAIG